MSMINISGIPNMGFAGGGGGVFGGNAATGQPALSAAEINAGIWGRYSPQQAQSTLNNIYGPGGFGAQPAYYAGLGAAYGRATGGFGLTPQGTPAAAGRVGTISNPGTSNPAYLAALTRNYTPLAPQSRAPAFGNYNPFSFDPAAMRAPATSFTPPAASFNSRFQSMQPPAARAPDLSAWYGGLPGGTRAYNSWNLGLPAQGGFGLAGPSALQRVQIHTGTPTMPQTRSVAQPDFSALFQNRAMDPLGMRANMFNQGAIDAVTPGRSFDFRGPYQNQSPFSTDLGGRSRAPAVNPMNRVDWAQSYGAGNPAMSAALRSLGASRTAATPADRMGSFPTAVGSAVDAFRNFALARSGVPTSPANRMGSFAPVADRNAMALALMNRGNALDMPSGQFGGRSPQTFGAPAAGNLGGRGIYEDPFGGMGYRPGGAISPALMSRLR